MYDFERFPSCSPHKAQYDQPSQARARLRAPKPAILIVDDAPDNLALLRTMMLRQGYQTFVATSGERALEIAQRIKPDLVLLDVVMPGIDGLETCRRLKATRPPRASR
jgi:CheY-like chemotaxis protein